MLANELERLTSAVADRYAIERELGHGGMATVYLALDLKHQRPVALKVLHPQLAHTLGPERFLREITVTAQLDHPHILPLLDSGEADGFLYYVMPYVEGESLRDRLVREKQLPLDDAIQIAREVADALGHAHSRGIVHRDIKPENVLLAGRHARVADFGIARAVSAAGGETLTETGLAIGTPAYMSPEQAGGEKDLDGRSDLYALGCVLYEMLAGHPPFTGVTALEILARHSMDAVPRLSAARPTVPPDLERTIAIALAKAPADRFATAGQFAEALVRRESATASAVPPARRLGRFALFGVAALVLAVGALLIFRPWKLASPPTGPAPGRTAVAVLPFGVLDSSPDAGYLADGMTDGLIADLAQIGSLMIISQSSGALAEEGNPSLSEIAKQLGVAAVVKGSILRTGDTVRVSVRLFHAAEGATPWTKDYDAPLDGLPRLQRDITLAIAGEIDAELKQEERQRLGTGQEVDQRAYEAYLRGRFHMERDELEQARARFEQARDAAPNWAPPYVGLANYYMALPFSSDVPPIDVLPKARAALVRALDLDETLAEAHAAFAYIRAYYEWDWRAAEREFQRALELQPSYADAYFSYSRFLASRGRPDEALAQIRRAMELDPLSLPLRANAALLSYFAGQYGEALAQLQEVLRTDSTNGMAKWGVALVAEQQGRADEAIAILKPITGASLNRLASLGHAYAIAGRVAQARAVLDTLHARAAQSYVPSYYFALLYAGLGDRDQAMQWLERAYQERSTVLAYLRIDPRLRPLHDDPRFAALVQRIGGD